MNGLIVGWEDLVEMSYIEGFVINSYYCAVNNRWVLLVVGADGVFRSVNHDMLGLKVVGMGTLVEHFQGGDRT